ncbi:acidic endochitinase-like [Prosopis cineraria]|uniref:acidic endochitinase-like n=1 Tax=Prosopis cineraria TaxID=364024 RepID=UPI00240ECE57|nr:acidic endochitinase-like [Prosopis cineraria]
MASKKRAFILLFSFFSFFSTIHSSNTDQCTSTSSIAVSVYWGQNTAEGTLKEACDTDNYNIVILQSLLLYDDASTPYLNFAGHCGGAHDPCTKLESEIKHCQSKGIKVFLSIGGIIIPPSSSHHYVIASLEDVAYKVAEYLRDNFLSGQFGPLGSVALDGIDIISVAEGRNIHWDDLVKAILHVSHERKVLISAAPQCVYPDYFLDKLIKTGLVDYLWVQFYHNSPCEYSNGNSVNLFRAWEEWSLSVEAHNMFVFLGAPASPNAVSSGYIPPEVLKSDVLPTVKKSSNFGGVMVFNRYFDKQTNYSGQIKDSVSNNCAYKCVCDDDVSNHLSY